MASRLKPLKHAANSLQPRGRHHKNVRQKMKITPKRLLIVIACVPILLIGLIMSCLWTSDYKITLHTAKIEWLPTSAKDVSQKIRTGFGASETIECTIPEKDFLTLAAARDWRIKPEERFTASLRIEGLPKLREIPMLGPADIVLRGYQYQSIASNGGGISVWFDSDLQRMIYATSDR